MKGSEHPLSKIDDYTAKQICILLQNNELTYDEIANLTNSTYSIVKKIKNRVRWKHISKEHDFSNYIPKKERLILRKMEEKNISDNNITKL